MIPQRHSIKRQVIELKVRDPEQAKLLQEEVSRVYRQRIIPLLDRCFSELSDPDTLYRIDSLELDIGSLDPQKLERDFVEKINSTLRRELAAQINTQKHRMTDRTQDPKIRSQVEFFVFFARTGSLPWWVDTSRPQLLAENLKELLQEGAHEFRTVLRKLLSDPRSRRRISNQYTDEQLVDLAGLFVPSYKASLAQDFPVLSKLSAGTTAISGWQPSRLRQSLWNNILQVASLGGQSYSTLQAFYRSILSRVAAELGISADLLIRQMEQALVHEKGFGNSARRSEAAKLLQLLAPNVEKEGLHQERSLLPGQQTDQREERRTAQKEDSHQEKSLLLGRQADQREEDKISHWQPVRTGSREDQPPDEMRLDLNFSESEETYVDNAGLVILWPFLEHFFARLDLLEDKRFKNFAAQQRAVGLLQVIVTQEPLPPEYLLPLNKLLCGLDLSEIFDFGPPLLDSEVEECENLLEAVIAQAPILHDMSTAGFRGTFLLRRGMLNAPDGFPLLRVERETYDVVLDRFPWGWQWVKLPWMEAPLRVEW